MSLRSASVNEELRWLPRERLLQATVAAGPLPRETIAAYGPSDPHAGYPPLRALPPGASMSRVRLCAEPFQQYGPVWELGDSHVPDREVKAPRTSPVSDCRSTLVVTWRQEPFVAGAGDQAERSSTITAGGKHDGQHGIAPLPLSPAVRVRGDPATLPGPRPGKDGGTGTLGRRGRGGRTGQRRRVGRRGRHGRRWLGHRRFAGRRLGDRRLGDWRLGDRRLGRIRRG